MSVRTTGTEIFDFFHFFGFEKNFKICDFFWIFSLLNSSKVVNFFEIFSKKIFFLKIFWEKKNFFENFFKFSFYKLDIFLYFTVYSHYYNLDIFKYDLKVQPQLKLKVKNQKNQKNQKITCLLCVHSKIFVRLFFDVMLISCKNISLFVLILAI